MFVSVKVQPHMLSKLGQHSKYLRLFAPRVFALEEVVLSEVIRAVNRVHCELICRGYIALTS